MAGDTPITYDLAEDILEALFGYWADDEPDWWADMIEALLARETVEAAKRWLDDGGVDPARKLGEVHGHDRHR